MNKVYVLITGEYSNQQVKGVFTEDHYDECKLCEELCNDARIQEFELNAFRPVDPGRDFFQVNMDRSGNVVLHHKLSRLDENGEQHYENCSLRSYKDYGVRKSYWMLQWMGYADDLKHAVKIVNEIRMQILAGQCPPGVDMGKNVPIAEQGKT